MAPEKLQQCLEESFGDLEPPVFEELSSSYFIGTSFEDAVRTYTARTTPWQKLRPLRQYLLGSLDIIQLRPKACQYYLPAYLYAMTDPNDLYCYLCPVLDILWYDDDDENPPSNLSYYRDRWEGFAALLTDRQKRCIAHFLRGSLETNR